MSFPFDRRFVYPSKNEAEEAVIHQENRINHVAQWLAEHGAPITYEVIVVCSDFPSKLAPLHWCIPHLVYHGQDDDKRPARIQMSLYHALQRPDIALVDLSRGLGSAAPTPEQPFRRLPSKQITLEHWIEPEPFMELPPVPRPFGPYRDDSDDECMLSNSSDQFKTGAQWTDSDESLWEKEETRRGFARYWRWRQISTVRSDRPA